MTCFDSCSKLKAAFPGQSDVHKDEIGQRRLDIFQGFYSIRYPFNDHKGELPTQSLIKSLTEGRAVLNDQCFQHLSSCRFPAHFSRNSSIFSLSLIPPGASAPAGSRPIPLPILKRAFMVFFTRLHRNGKYCIRCKSLRGTWYFFAIDAVGRRRYGAPIVTQAVPKLSFENPYT